MTRFRKGSGQGAPAREPGGFSLVEMLVALVAGMIVCTAVVAFLLSSMKSNGEYVQSTRLTQELRNTLDLVTRDLSRAGYNDDALTLASLPGSVSAFGPVLIKDDAPFVTAGTAATYPNADTNGCVLYAYDRTFPLGYKGIAACAAKGCGTAGKIDVAYGEIRGIRRTCIDGACDGEADDVGVVEFAESTAAVTPACNGASPDYAVDPETCGAGGWCRLSDPTALNITRFMVIDASSELSNSMRIRDLGIHLEGQLLTGSDFTRAVSTKVKIHADCINPSVASCASAPAP